MKQKIFIINLLLMILLSGCSKGVNEIVDLTKKSNQALETAQMKSRDARRVSEAKILDIRIQLYADGTGKLPVAKDDAGNFKSLKLIKNSADFKQLDAELLRFENEQALEADPLDPERYYEYFSNGEIYSIKAFLEQNNFEKCKESKPGYCEFEIRGKLESALK